MRVGIVGAGIAGLACAEGLVQAGHDVVLFDKGRGPGGRMSTRRIETSEGVAHFDHGAQYFTVRDRDFQSRVNTWIAEGVVAAWPAAGGEAHVGVPAMNAPIRNLADRHAVHWAARVTGLEKRGGGWRLGLDTGDFHEVDVVVIAVPAEQAAELLAPVAPELAARARVAISEPCWTVMAAFSEPVAFTPDCLRGEVTVGWAARNNAKPGRTGPESWVIQATPEWTRRHIDADRDAVTADLLAALSHELGVALPAPLALAAHLWRFARCAQDGPGVLLDDDLGLCGDWLVGPRIESAWISGARLADRIVAETSNAPR